MGAAASDIIRITDFQDLMGETVINVYHYRVNDLTPLTGDYLALFGDSFVDIVLPKVAALQDAELQHTHLYLENLSNGVDIETYTTDFPVAGSNGFDNPMPPFVTLGFELFRSSRAVRNGHKSVGGVSENQVTNGIYTGSSTPTDDYADALAASFTSGIVTYATPIILRQQPSIPLVSPVWAVVIGAEFKGVGSQNTRKFGRGV